MGMHSSLTQFEKRLSQSELGLSSSFILLFSHHAFLLSVSFCHFFFFVISIYHSIQSDIGPKCEAKASNMLLKCEVNKYPLLIHYLPLGIL